MQIRILAASILAMVMSACGAPGGSQLTLDGSNVGGVASAASSAIVYADLAKAMAGSAGAFSAEGGISKTVAGGYTPAAITFDCNSGNIVVDVTGDSTAGTSSLQYNQCAYILGGGSSLIMNGSASSSWTSTSYTMSMPSFSFTVTGTQSFDMTLTNYTATVNTSLHTLDFGVTIDSSALNGSFTIETIDTLTYSSVYPTAGTIRVSANGTADITYYSGGFTITYNGGTIDCPGYSCPAS